jgi:alkanesulfonate monooxygenase SsuD/methylene tetrahydromethanopterin reductase-like flavin-dependent oxidoreductase (luciferase family)
MKLGVLVEGEEGLDWDNWRRVGALAERLGFESIWVSDHFRSPWVHDRHGLDAWMALAVAAAETRRLQLGPLVSPITFREPAIMARMAESLHDLSRGRFVLGLGLGWNADEHREAAIGFPPAAQRRQRLMDGIKLIRRILGKRHVPLLIGGGGPQATLPLVARYADHWNMTTSSVELYRARNERLDELCRAIGRDPGRLRRSVAVGYLIGRDSTELEARCERLRRVVPPLAEATDVVMAARQMGWVAGTSSEVAEHLRALADAGADLAILGHYDLEDDASLELVAHEVMPVLG